MHSKVRIEQELDFNVQLKLININAMRESGTLKLLTVIAGVLMLLGSCSTPKEIAYFQDVKGSDSAVVAAPVPITFQSGDKLSIVVKSKDAELSDLFNLPTVSYRVGQGASSSFFNSTQNISLYTVNSDGTIDFPVLGKVHIGGLKREEVAALIKGMLIGRDLVKDPVVTVDFANLYYSVLGEVKTPGRYSIDRDQVTLLDAISKAGDLTIYGLRDSITVLREENGQRKAYNVSMLSWKDLTSSPAYYIKQNDVVYVKPNDTRARQSTVNGNNVRSTSFWISLASLLTSVAVLIFK